ncbi:MAG: pyruvate kinase, partial [Anaerolineaceae bacterium]|nr:pyruvate kinase [Anaerolineaceae bacterium]
MDRKVKIVATIGPSCSDETTLSSLIQAGMDVARLNFSHGNHAAHAEYIGSIRKLSTKLGKPVAILQDLQGPKLRVGRLPESGIALKADQIVTLMPADAGVRTPPSIPKQSCILPMDVPNLLSNVFPGCRILLDDGSMEMIVEEIGEAHIVARVIQGGILYSNKGVNLPGISLDIPAFTDKDALDLEFGLKHKVDLIALSFVRTASDIEIVQEAIRKLSPSQAGTPIIAKLERPEAVDNLDSILKTADGVMVARGDLGVETSPSAVPIMQKKIIAAASFYSKPVITATQMLDSMIHSPRPTRAEASDVANAVFDGSDAVMLSGETASGIYPVESVRMMDKIVCEAEQHFLEWGTCHQQLEEPTRDDAVSLTRAARELAHDRNVAAIAVFTETGRTALLMSK